MGTADIAVFHVQVAICFLTYYAHKPAVGANGLVIDGVWFDALAASNSSTNRACNSVVVACHPIAEFTLKRAFVVFFSAINYAFYIITFLTPVIITNWTNPCMKIKFSAMSRTNCQNKHLPDINWLIFD
jgi:hypothetical protein